MDEGDLAAFYADRDDERAEPNRYGCTCPCHACRADYCAMCELGYP